MPTQAELWNDANAKRWAKLRPALASMLAPFGEAAQQALQPRPGEKALDVGCGFGDTTVALARQTGDALGVDVSAPMLEVARSEAVPGARYVLADAQTAQFDQAFDLLYSRFGVMFFEDPESAFANLCRALAGGGRLAFAVWGPFEENDWASVPLQVLRRHIPGPSLPQPGPGPFSLSSADRLRDLLGGAGFAETSVRPVRLERKVHPDLLLQSGPAANALREAGEEGQRLFPQLEKEVAAALPDHITSVALVATAVKP